MWPPDETRPEAELARETADLLSQQGIEKIVLVTSAAHMMRGVLPNKKVYTQAAAEYTALAQPARPPGVGQSVGVSGRHAPTSP